MVDAVDSKSTVGDIVRVRVPPSVPRRHSRISDKVFLSLVNNDLRALRCPFSFKGVRLKPGAYWGTIRGIRLMPPRRQLPNAHRYRNLQHESPSTGSRRWISAGSRSTGKQVSAVEAPTLQPPEHAVAARTSSQLGRRVMTHAQIIIGAPGDSLPAAALGMSAHRPKLARRPHQLGPNLG